MSHRTAEEIEQSTEKLLQDLQAVVRDGEELLQAGASHLSDCGVAARERLVAALDMAKETRRKLEKSARAGAQAADRLVRDNPYTSLGVAFGVGLLLAMVMARRR